MAKPSNDPKIPGYRILRELGRGGMANVYLAEQESIEREVALKVMLPALAAGDSSFSARFLREAKIVARLAHPHITAVYDVGVAGPYHYFSMEYVTGGDLKSRIREGMMPKLAFTIARQIAAALAFAHAKGYVHRDVKPENVLFRQDGTALLSDFGIAKSTDAAIQMTATGVVIGTPHYMSPEQAQGQELDQRSDLYSLGIMLYEMLTGELPYTGNSALSIGIKHLKEPIPHLAPPTHVYQPLIDKLLAKSSADRYQNGEEVIAAIDAMTANTQTLHTTPTVTTGSGTAATIITKPNATRAPTPASSMLKTKKRRLLPVAAVLGVLLLTGGVAFLMLRETHAPAPAGGTTTAPTPPATPERATQNIGRIATLLTAADTAALAGRYLEPRDNNSVSGYRMVLEIEPGNARAARGLQEIAGHFLAQAERAIEKKDYDRADGLLKNAEQADPNHPLLFSRRLTLGEMRQKQMPKSEGASKPAAAKPAPAPAITAKTEPPKVAIENAYQARQREAREHEQRLGGLYARLQELIAPGNLSATRLGLARELLAEATKLAPNDTRANSAAGQIADGYLRLATTQVEKKEYKEAEGLVRRGLELKPDHRLLLSLEKDVAGKQKPKRQSFGTF
jgi:tetratricopeptide (TPR) repeat protein